MKKMMMLITLAALTVFSVLTANGEVIYVENPTIKDIDIDDGKSHTISEKYDFGDVRIDHETDRNPGTHVDIIEGGSVTYLKTYNHSTVTISGGGAYEVGLHNNSTINISGGKISKYRLDAHDNSTVNMTDGTIVGSLLAHDNANVVFSGGTIGHALGADGNSSITMSGGKVLDNLGAGHNAILTISGGTVGEKIQVGYNGTIILVGSNFKVNDSPLSNGDGLRGLGRLIEDDFSGDHYTGTISGTLADGTPLNSTFNLFHTGEEAGTANIIINSPESMGLIRIGCLVMIGVIGLVLAMAGGRSLKKRKGSSSDSTAAIS